jgi:hypothetical protein
MTDITEPVQVTKARKWLQKTAAEDANRDLEYEKLAAAYDGFLFDLEQGDMTKRGTVISKDLRDNESGDGEAQFYEIPANMVRPLTEDWKSVIGVLPSVYVPPAKAGDSAASMSANKREKIIEAIDFDSAMTINFMSGAHYQTLYGCQIHQCVPDPDSKRVKKRVISPYHAHARTSLDGINLHYLAFDWDEDTDLLVEEYPGLKKILKKEDGEWPETMKVTEWNDKNNRLFMVDGKYVEDLPLVEHNWGFVPAVVIPNIIGTGSIWSRSDAQQAVYMTQIFSEVISMQHDALFQHVHDEVLAFADKPITQMAIGPHQMTQFEKDATVRMLHQGMNLPDVSASLAVLERLIRLQGGWPEVMSSELDSSVISGKAFTAAQGPVAARAALKHIIMAEYMQRSNSFALMLYDRLFPNEEIEILRVTGGISSNIFPKAGRAGAEFVSFVPSRDINGRYDNLLTFSPTGSDQYRQSIQWLQYAEAGVISINFIRENTQGIDPQAMEAEVAREFMEKAERSIRANQMAMDAQNQAMQAMAPQGAAPGGGAPAGAEAGGAAGGGGAPQVSVSLEQEAATQAPEAAPSVPGAKGGGTTLREATQVFKSVRNVRGEVYLAGAIVTTGWTDGPIEVYVEIPQDKGTIIRGTPYGASGKLLFHNFPLPDDEKVVNVTPQDAAMRREEEAIPVGQTA